MKKCMLVAMVMMAGIATTITGLKAGHPEVSWSPETTVYCTKEIPVPGTLTGNVTLETDLDSIYIRAFKVSVSEGKAEVIYSPEKLGKGIRTVNFTIKFDSPANIALAVMFKDDNKQDSENEPPASAHIYAAVEKELVFKPKQISAKSDYPELKEKDYTWKIKVKTNPVGYEGEVDVDIDEVKPGVGDDKGTLEKESDKLYKYTAFEEEKTDKWPGHDGIYERYWDISFLREIDDCGCKQENTILSVFRYFRDARGSYKKALNYVAWKYDDVLSGKVIGSYSHISNFWAKTLLPYAYGWTGIFSGRVHYTEYAFDSENILASIVVHENEHSANQNWLLRFRGVNDARNYMMFSVNGTTVPEPPTIPQEDTLYGYNWAIMEFPAYMAEFSAKNGTGIITHNGGYLDQTVQPELEFFSYFISRGF